MSAYERGEALVPKDVVGVEVEVSHREVGGFSFSCSTSSRRASARRAPPWRVFNSPFSDLDFRFGIFFIFKCPLGLK